MNKLPTENSLLEKAVLHSAKTKAARSKLKECREVILYLKDNKYNFNQISKFLNNNNIKTVPTSVSRYLKNHPATEDELEEIRKETKIVKERVLPNRKAEEDKLKQTILSEINKPLKKESEEEKLNRLAGLFGE